MQTNDRAEGRAGTATMKAMPQKMNLTRRQEQVHRAMLEHQAREGLPATIRELGEALDITSTYGVVVHLEALERKGYATKTARRARGWVAHRRGDSPRAVVLGVLAETLDVMPDISLGRLLMRAADGQLANLSDEDLARSVQALAARYRRADHG